MDENRYHLGMKIRIDPSLAKTLSFAAVHFTVAFSLGWLLTGSVVVGGVLALVEPACNTVAFYVHEKLWARAARARAGQRLASASAA